MKVSLEELLRVKRAEKPAPEFWQRFDEELRAKQLAAIVHRPSWWQSLPRPGFRALWVRLPIGAAAVVALSLVAVREYRPASAIGTEELRPTTLNPGSAVTAIETPAAVAFEASGGGSIASVGEVPAQGTVGEVAAPVEQESRASAIPEKRYSAQLIAMNRELLRDSGFARFASMRIEQASLAGPAREPLTTVPTPSTRAGKLTARLGAAWSHPGDAGDAGEYRNAPTLTNPKNTALHFEVPQLNKLYLGL